MSAPWLDRLPRRKKTTTLPLPQKGDEGNCSTVLQSSSTQSKEKRRNYNKVEHGCKQHAPSWKERPESACIALDQSTKPPSIPKQNKSNFDLQQATMKSQKKRKGAKRKKDQSKSFSPLQLTKKPRHSTTSPRPALKNSKPSKKCAQTKNGSIMMRSAKIERHYLYDTGLTMNNHVPVERVLWPIIDPSFPILYFPEYAQRRLSSTSSAISMTTATYTNNGHNHPCSSKKIINESEIIKPSLHEFSDIPPSLVQVYLQMLSCTPFTSSNMNATIEKSSRKDRMSHRSNPTTTQNHSINNDCARITKQHHSTNKITNGHGDNSTSDDMINEILSRIIIIPFSKQITSSVARRNTTVKKTTNDSKTCERGQNDTGNTTNTSNSSLIHPNQTRVINRYKQSKPNPQLLRKRSINSSLNNIVDGVITSLVQLREKTKRKHRLQIHSNANNMNHSTTPSSSTTITHSSSKLFKQQLLELNQVRNLLSEGYTYVRERDGTSTEKNMPGIKCTHPNSSASYASTSPVMKRMHDILGDDAMREVLLYCHVLVPCVNVDEDGGDGMLKRDGWKMKGNYFQLCGMDLTNVKKSSSSIHIKRSLTPHNESKGYPSSNGFRSQHSSITNGRKRKRNDECVLDDREGDLASGIADNTIQSNQLQNPKPTVDTTANNSSQKISKQHEVYDPHWLIPRYKMFYSDQYIKKIGFPPRHILNVLTVSESIGSNNDSGNRSIKDTSKEEQLLDRMIHIKYGSKQKRKKRWKRLRDGGISMCHLILKGHRKCDYHRILERYCPISCDIPSASFPELVQSSSSSDEVISFLSAVLKAVFPDTFWGSSHNFQTILRTIRTFITMRRRENIPMKEAMSGLKVMAFSWLFPTKTATSNAQVKDGKASTCRRKKSKVPRSSHEAATHLVYNIVRWLYCEFIIPLLRSVFYITETEFMGLRVSYYRKPIWSKFRTLTIKKLTNKQYVPISHQAAIQRVNSQQMGFSQLRLVPKTSGVRPIVLLNKSVGDLSLVRSKSFDCLDLNSKKVSTNIVLRKVLDVLQSEHEKNPNRFGAGLYGLHEMQHRLSDFVQKLRPVSGDKIGPLYIASADIKHCYDTIDQPYLYDLLKSIINENQYLVQKHSVLFPYDESAGPRRKVVKNVGVPGDMKDFSSICEEIGSRHFNSILVDNDRYTIVNTDDMLKLLEEHLSSHIVTTGHQCFAQKIGIPQGSVLSSILCNFYFGDIEKELLEGVFVKNGRERYNCKELVHTHLLVRIVDDFMLITTDQQTSHRFMKKMQCGIPKLGVKVNEDKSRISYGQDCSYSDYGFKAQKSVIQYGSDTFFPWCGMLFNLKTCEVQIDYERFRAIPTIDTLTVDRTVDIGMRLMERMKSFMRPRCQEALYDSRINSKEVIQVNLYQSYLYSAVKTFTYVSEMPKKAQNMLFVQKCVDQLIHFGYNLISSRLKTLESKQWTIEKHDSTRINLLSNWVSRHDALWLGKHAFESICCAKSNSNDILHKRVECRDYTPDKFKKVVQKALDSFELHKFHL